MEHYGIYRNLDDESEHDEDKAAVIGGVGGAFVGAAAGSVLGPAGAAAGAAIGAVIGVGASGAIVHEVDLHDDDGSAGEVHPDKEEITVAEDPAFETRARRLDREADTVYELDEDEAEIYHPNKDVRPRSLFDRDEI